MRVFSLFEFSAALDQLCDPVSVTASHWGFSASTRAYLWWSRPDAPVLSRTSTPFVTRYEYCDPLSEPLSRSPRTATPARCLATSTLEMSERVRVSSSKPTECSAPFKVE